MHAVIEQAAGVARDRAIGQERLAVAGNVVLVAGLLALFARALGWIGASLTMSTHAWNLALLAGVLVLVVRGPATRGVLARALRTPPRIEPLPLLLLVAAVVAHVAIRRVLDIHIAAAALFGLALFALLGLYLPRPTWTRAAPLALLAVALLPFGDQADAYLGFPARLLTARGAAALLSALGVPSLDAETVLFLDNGVAHVDIPCSGLSSLWTGTLFFLGLLALERRRLSRRNVALLALLVGLLLVVNTLRVAAVVGLQIALRRATLAELLHAPLGVLGFAAACVALRAAVHAFDTTGRSPSAAPPPRRALPPALHLGLGAGLLVAALIPAVPTAAPRSAKTPSPLTLPAGVTSEPLPLTSSEAVIYQRFGARLADKRRIHLGARGGTLLLVESESFRAHHPPEACLAAAGHRVEQLHRVELDDTHAYRLASLDGGRATALFWYQSPARTVDSLLARMAWQALDRQPRWVQVTLLLDEPSRSIAREGRDLHRLVHDAVHAALDEEQQ